MTKEIALDTWVYVVVQDPGKDEHIVGQEDAEQKVAFIPAFLDKDSALQGNARLIKEKGSKYEVQAIIFEDLVGHATAGKFLIFVLDEEGTILNKFSPDGKQM
jgi:hypothetical protein